MKKLFNWILVLGAMVGAFYGVGLIVPRSLKLGSYTNVQASTREVYEIVSDPTTWPRWHPDFLSVTELPERDRERFWRVTDKQGHFFEMAESIADEGKRWQGNYEIEGTRTSWRIDVAGYGEGTRVIVVKTIDTRDPWLRAKRFLWFEEGSSALATLNSLQTYLGETPAAVKDND